MEMAKQLWNYPEILSLYKSLSKLAAPVTEEDVESLFYRFTMANIVLVPERSGVLKLYEAADEKHLIRVEHIDTKTGRAVTMRSRLKEYKEGIEPISSSEIEYFRWIVCDDAQIREQEELAEFKQQYGKLPKYNET
jgi:hypothetical protein